MSVQSNSSQASAGTDGEPTGETGHAADAAAAELGLPADALGLQIVQLLAESHPSAPASDSVDGLADASAYDGHVALALDTDILPDIDATLDMLTSSHQLFDVPALDVANVIDDSLPT
jgi:hypothetical protein